MGTPLMTSPVDFILTLNTGLLPVSYPCVCSIYAGITLWDSSVLEAALSKNSYSKNSLPSSSFEVTAEDTVSSKMNYLGVEGNLSLSVLSGLVAPVSGSAKYVHDQKSSNNKSRVTLKYNCSSKFQQLTMEQLGKSKIQHPDVFEKQTATHVVTGVLFGAEAFFIFDREVTSNENRHNVVGNMEVVVKAIPDIIKVGEGGAGLDISHQQKQEAEKFQCKFYGDIILESNPSSFQDVVKVYKELPSKFLEEDNTVPKKVWLYPLSSLDSKAARMVREISTSLVTQVQEEFDALNLIEIRSSDLINTEIDDCFSSLKDQVIHFKKMIKEHKMEFMKRLSAVLPTIRGGGGEEQQLADLLGEIHKSPFNTRSLEKWIKIKEKEIKDLTQYLNVLKNVKGLSQSSINCFYNEFNYRSKTFLWCW